MDCERCHISLSNDSIELCNDCLEYLIEKDMYYDKITNRDYKRDSMIKIGMILMSKK